MVATMMVLLLTADPQGHPAIGEALPRTAVHDGGDYTAGTPGRSRRAAHFDAAGVGHSAVVASREACQVPASQRFYRGRSYNYRLLADYPWHAAASWAQPCYPRDRYSRPGGCREAPPAAAPLQIPARQPSRLGVKNHRPSGEPH